MIGVGALVAGCDSRKSVKGAVSSEPTPPVPVQPAPPPPPAPKTVLSWHYAGAAQVASDTNGTRLKAVLSTPTSKALLDLAQASLSQYPDRVFLSQTNLTNGTCARLMEPLVGDLAQSESYLLGLKSSDQTDYVLATRLQEERAVVWQTNLLQLAAALGGQPSPWKSGNFEGFEAQLTQPSAQLRLLRSGDWVLAGIGQGSFRSLSNAMERLTRDGRPGDPFSTNAWLEIEADLATWDSAASATGITNLPMVRLAVGGRGEKVRTTGQAAFPAPHTFQTEPWDIPTNTVREPLVSFAAAQPSKAWLQAREGLRALPPAMIPSQLFGWSLADVPFQTYAAFPCPNAGATLSQTLETLADLITSNQVFTMPLDIQFNTNTHEMSILGLPLVAPFLHPSAEPDTNFLVAGFFPYPKKGKPAPTELFDQVLQRTNLLAYAWEVTAPRLESWRTTALLYMAFAGYVSPNTNSASFIWSQDTNVTSQLDNCVTEISIASPSQLELVRSSAIGFTGLELSLLTRWLENPAFPGFRPPDKVVRRSRPSAPTAAPPALPQ
jgi:hypothetical protein